MSKNLRMSQTSSEGQFWRCSNPNCSPPNPIPLAVGCTFKTCPYCQTPASQVTNTMQLSDLTSQQPPETGVPNSSVYSDATIPRPTTEETGTVSKVSSSMENSQARSEEVDSDSLATVKHRSKRTGSLLVDPKSLRSGQASAPCPSRRRHTMSQVPQTTTSMTQSNGNVSSDERTKEGFKISKLPRRRPSRPAPAPPPAAKVVTDEKVQEKILDLKNAVPPPQESQPSPPSQRPRKPPSRPAPVPPPAGKGMTDEKVQEKILDLKNTAPPPQESQLSPPSQHPQSSQLLQDSQGSPSSQPSQGSPASQCLPMSTQKATAICHDTEDRGKVLIGQQSPSAVPNGKAEEATSPTNPDQENLYSEDQKSSFLQSTKTIEVVFHVIVPKHFWEWSEDSTVYLRFENEELGGWKQDMGSFEQRDIDEKFCEMTCSLSFTPLIVSHWIAYKYVVYSPKSMEAKNVFEFLRVRNYSNSNVKRGIHLSEDQWKTTYHHGGCYHQYDSMVLPEDLHVSRTWGTEEKLKSKVRSFFSGKKVQLKLPSNEEMDRNCLSGYLTLYKNHLIEANFDSAIAVKEFVEEVQYIFFSMTEFTFVDVKKGYFKDKRENHSILQKEFVEWLGFAAMSLQDLTTEKQLLCATCIVWCLSRIGVSFDMPEIKALVPILRFLCAHQPTEQHGQWREFNNLCNFVPLKEDRLEIAEAVRKLVSARWNIKKGALEMDWIFGIPLHTFLTETYEMPLMKRDSSMLIECWSELNRKFNLTEIQKKFHKEKIKVSKHYDKMCSLCRLNPHTLQVLVYVCPDANLKKLFSRIPPHVSMTWLYCKIQTKEQLPQLCVWMNVIRASMINVDYSNVVESSSILLDSSMQLFESYFKYVAKTFSESHVSVITAAASLVCNALPHVHEKKEEVCAKTITKMSRVIREWICDPYVIGGKMFGCYTISRHRNNSIFYKGAAEMLIWKSLLSFECSDETVYDDWRSVIQTLFLDRISNVPDFAILQLLLFVEQQGVDTLTDVAMTVTIRAADSILSTSSDKQLETVSEIVRENSKVLGFVLGNILENHYPQLKETAENDWVTLDVLLGWVLWPNYLEITMQGKKCLLREGLSQECLTACACALSLCKDVCMRIQQGKVTVLELQKISNNRELMDRLCKVADGKKMYLSVSKLDQMLQQFEFFQKHRQAYQTVCNWISSGPYRIKGLTSLKEELKEDISSVNICDLCQFKDGALTLLRYQEAKPLDVFVEHFLIMMHTDKNTDLFLHPLDKRLRETVLSKTDLTLYDIYPKIWQPVFQECCELIKTLIDLSMKLSYVDAHLKMYSDNLEKVVEDLADGINRCLNKGSNKHQLQKALQSIRNYWSLVEYQAGAQVFLQLRDVLRLKGNFDVIENFSSQVDNSMKEQTLAYISGNLLNTGRFLETIVNNSLKKRCLQAFTESQAIITWLRNTTRGVNDIQGFVTLALATAAGGEGDLVHDRLSHLRTVGSGYASLIYIKSGERDDYKMLMERCTSLWEALDKNHHLPELLISCNRDVEWYKSLKDTQGSVETTSYGQMTSILKYGRYRVECKQNSKTVNDLISVTLTHQSQKLIKTRYSLDELRDLESKLVLICGNKADTRAEVDHYLNLLHSATRIAELYLDLQRAGDVTYSTAHIEFRCAVYSVLDLKKDPKLNEGLAKKKVSDLHEYSRMLDTQLVEWKRSVDSARERHYELNYFTTRQLLELRRELGTLLHSTTVVSSVKPSVLMLLKSVSPEVSASVVLESLQATHFALEPTKGANAKQGGSCLTAKAGSSMIGQKFNGNHPDVRDLVEAGYDLQAAVKAMEQFGDVGEAMSYLDKQERQEVEGFVKPFSRERHVKEDIVGENDILEYRGPDTNKSNLNLDHLGRVLQTIRSTLPGSVCSPRTFDTNLLKAGFPNLLVTSQDNILRSVLALYVRDTNLPLPTHEEVLLCTHETTAEEVSLLWRRSINDPGFNRIFCLAHAEKLSYHVCDAALKSLAELSQGKNKYRLVVICSEENRDKSHIISRLHLYKIPAVPKWSENEYKKYLMFHFTSPSFYPTFRVTTQRAAIVDPDNSCVRVVKSSRSGMGKSLYIKSRGQKLITIPIHGPVVTNDTLLDFLNHHINQDPCTIYHLDIAPRVLKEVDCLLFSLLILKGLSDSRGHVWKCSPSQLYMIEVTIPENTKKGFQTLMFLDLLPTVLCISPREFARSDSSGTEEIGMDEEEFRSPMTQRVYQYLKKYSTGRNMDKFKHDVHRKEGSVRDFLKVILSECGINDPSWAEVRHFTKFLDIQLNSCENSIFFNESLVGDIMSGLKSFVVKFMIRMSQDFSTPSLVGVVARENPGGRARRGDVLEQHQIVERRHWEQASHPYIFFNDDGETITFVGFRVTAKGDLIDPNGKKVIEIAIMSPQLYTGLKQNQVNFDEDYRKWNKQQMIHKLSTVMGFDHKRDPDTSYVLTADNLIKMLAIQMRFRCDIPVVIMGETGCGKTRLIRYMCDLARQEKKLKNLFILKIHGGVTDHDIVKFIKDAQKVAKFNKSKDPRLSTVVFFDEANTTESIGLIKEIMCDRRMNGRAVSEDLKFIAACNPYRKHSEKMIEKLETAGLGFYVRKTETQQKLGKIPLRHLVYRVLDLPSSMRPLVYDFGQLKTGTENDYIKQIVTDYVKGHRKLSREGHGVIPVVSAVLAASQKFMRDQKNECSFVSLRDVERAMIVFQFFYEKMDLFAPLINAKIVQAASSSLPPVPPNNITRALVLALSVCYHARLQEREPYEELIAQFSDPVGLPGRAKQFRNEIKWCQEGLLDQMVLGPNIAKNAALRENVFMMAICIELRIPLFLVGKPGSSKSLAKSIIQDSMHGQASQTPLLRQFKQVHLFSYQCSQLSTPESVIEVFKSAERFQATQDIKQYVSVVVLDEVGLAEDSPSLPLKALHPLLEDGTEGAGKDHQQQTVEREKRVAFIGISNWALDPAKMNRGVMVTRGVPGLKELILSAHGICSTEERDPVREQLQSYFAPLSHAYMTICEKQERQFFGLRDFYSLIKMLYWMCSNSKCHPLSGRQLEHAIRRNFGGLESDNFNPLEEFQRAVGNLEYTEVLVPTRGELRSKLNPDCSRHGLIKASLNSKDSTWHGENRYLLFLTENYAALNILKNYLNVGNDGTENEDQTLGPYILFGSSFPKDKEYTQVCRNINQVKICMETGRTVILLNLENLYESLYDVLNQYYMYHGGVRYVDLGLQTHRVKCRVHDNFKLILIAEKDTVYKKFPTPLINRLEKHFVLTSSVLEGWQLKVLREFEKWIQAFSRTSDTRGSQFREEHAFIGYQKDTPAAVIFQATTLLRRLVEKSGEAERLHLQRAGVLTDDLSGLFEAGEKSPRWLEAVFRLSQFLLLQTAADDTVFRLQKSTLPKEEVDTCMRLYYKHQHHGSIREFLEYELEQNKEMFMQVTTRSPLMTQEELKAVAESLSVGFAHFDLLEFDTELDFSNKIGPKFHGKGTQIQPFLIIIQCDSGHLNSDLIACARYRVCDEAIKAKAINEIDGRKYVTHILFLIRLPQQEVRSHFVGFQSDPWISVHIDDLAPTSEAKVVPEQALTAKISELFKGEIEAKAEPAEPVDRANKSKVVHAQHRRLLGCVQAAVSMLKDPEQDRSMLRIKKLLSLIPKTMADHCEQEDMSFYFLLVKFIHKALKRREEIRVDEKDWVLMEAMSSRKLQSGGTFSNVLARRIGEVITPYFAELIAHMDQNCNLDLLDVQQASPISQFWLEMFNLTAEQIDFTSLASGKTDVKMDFHCMLPFSWYIRETVEAQRVNASGKSHDLRQSLNTILDAVCETAVGSILSSVSVDKVVELYNYYLNDFVQYVYHSSNKGDLRDNEFKLVRNALTAMTRNPELCSMDGHESLSHKIAALHLVYSQCSTEVLQFGQLVQHRPGIIQSLLQTNLFTDNVWEFSLHLNAVQRVLESDQEGDPNSQTLAGLNPPLHNKDESKIPQNVQRWLNHVHLSQNIIDTILRSCTTNEATIKARLTWQRIRALQIFAEKVYLPHCKVNGMLIIIRRLELTLKTTSDFLKNATLSVVMKIIRNMFAKVRVDAKTTEKIKRDCNNFYVEVISSLCFGGREAPEPELVKTLLDMVLHDTGTSKLLLYEPPDSAPTIRSFLLQLLLDKGYAQVEDYLSDYFSRSVKVMGGKLDQRLCLLCIQCFEDALHKEASIKHQSQRAARALEKSSPALLSEHQVSLKYLQAVAGVRFGLSVAAEQLKNGHVDERLLRATYELCIDRRVNVVDSVDTTGPLLYLVKLLIRQFGYPCLEAVCKVYPWILPEELKKSDTEEKKIFDPFIIYDEKYVRARRAMSAVVFTRTTEKLTACVKDGCDPSCLTFALYQEVTLSHASREPAKRVKDKVLEILNTFIQGFAGHSPQVMHTMRLLLGNQQGGVLAQMTVSPDQPTLCQMLSGIVVHTVSVVLSRNRASLLRPFVTMLNNPGALENAYLPTMAEDLLQEVRKAVRKAGGRGNFYDCPNGHTYFVGECGQPMQESVCPQCGERIGGTYHTLLSSNKTARQNDTTKTGYDLGPPERRSLNPERERDLSAPAVCVVRALMHSAFIWASCNKQQKLTDIARVTKGQEKGIGLPEFFWMHLEKDIECLRRVTRRGVEECVIIVHLVLQQMLTTVPNVSTGSEYLRTKDERKQWEHLFSTTYIDPILTNLGSSISRALDAVANDDQQDHDQLFYLAYEKVKVDESKLQAHLWTYRQQINLDHLQRTVQAANTEEIPVLDAFLQAEPSLRATQYLPDIVKLQQFLYDMYNKRLEKSRAEKLTVQDFLKEVKDKFNENTKHECQRRVESLKQAWAIVGHKLKNHNRLPIEDKYLLPKITSSTELIYLIPTTINEGRCSTALVDYLVLTHNNFIQHCCAAVSKGSESAAAVWRRYEVPITHLHHCHMLEYEQQLQSIILSHCHYSLTVGKGQEIAYDLPALEQHILNRFVYGKPTILVDIPHVAYRQAIYTTESFLEIRKKVRPQLALDQHIQQEILTELKTPDRLRESLDVVDIVLGLLSSGGGNSKIKLKQFISTRKMDRKSFSAKAKEHCTLSHIISLWETLSVELARQLWYSGQEPFEAIPGDYTKELSKSHRTDLDKCLRVFDLNILLGALFEFIEMHVKQIQSANETDYQLVDALDDYWAMTDQTPIDIDHFRRDIPGSLTVDQALATWKHVADYKVKHH